MDPENGQQPPSRGQEMAKNAAKNVGGAIAKKAIKTAAKEGLKYGTKALAGTASFGVGAAALEAADALKDPFGYAKKLIIVITAIILFLLILIILIVVVIIGGGGGAGGGPTATGSGTPVSSPSADPTPCPTGADCPTPTPTPTPGGDCNGKYAKIIAKNRFLKENFGDPACDFTKDGLYLLLNQVDAAHADHWFYKVVPCESGYNPNIWADPGTGTPNPYGAWGLYQMGSRFRSNNSYDRGDTPWRHQTGNAASYLRLLNGNGRRYWACW